jgi:hypothetical protein
MEDPMFTGWIYDHRKPHCVAMFFPRPNATKHPRSRVQRASKGKNGPARDSQIPFYPCNVVFHCKHRPWRRCGTEEYRTLPHSGLRLEADRN